MLSTIDAIFENTSINMNMSQFLLCIICALAIGLIHCMMYMYKTRYTESFVVTLAVLPAIVSVVIMMVNGNVGAGVAVAGAFSLVRFRSVPGTAKEIGAIFMAMGSGLIIGMGYIIYAVIFTILVGGAGVLFSYLKLGGGRNKILNKTIHIVIPENLDYTEIFDDLLKEYTSENELIRIKTTNMGSLFNLSYNIKLKDIKREKEFMDKLRCRNGNLEVIITKQETVLGEL